ncbi:MAG: hypothetical protein ABII00_08860 [Elusimicrobiota bacterium]
MQREDMTPKEMDAILNKKSGILGITQRYVDRRDVLEAAGKGDARAQLALDIEAYRIKKYIGAYAAALGRVDAVVFTAGVGEMSSVIRSQALQDLECLGIEIDEDRNELAKTRNAECVISADESKVRVFVIPTDEEHVMIEDVAALIEGAYDVHTDFTYRFQSKDYRNSHRDAEFERECTTDESLRWVSASPPYWFP